MKKSMLGFITLFLILSLAFSSFAEVCIDRITNEPITWTAFKGSHTVMGTQINDWSETMVAQLMAEKTGVTLEFVMPILGDEFSKMTLLISSNQLPDFIFNPDPWYTGGSEAMLQDGLIVDLAPYLDLMPNLKAALAESDLRMKEVFTDDGQMPALPIFHENDEESEVFIGVLIRKDLLDQVGMDVPETYDDWYKVLTAFKNECGISKPLSCGPQMWAQNNMWSSGFGFGFMDYFGTSNPFYQIDGQVRYAPVNDSEAFRAYLEMMAKWYAEGLIDPDFQSVTDVGAQIATYSSVECGACITPYSLSSVLNSIGQASKADFEYVCAPIPVLEKGQRTHIYYETSRISRHGLSITKNCKDIELAVKYWDQYYKKDVSNMTCWGFENDTYIVNENGQKLWTDKIVNDPNYNLLSMRYSVLGSDYPGTVDVKAAEVEAFSQEANALYRSRGDNVYRYPSSATLSEDERLVYDMVMPDVNQYVEEACLQFIMGQRSFDTFDEFVEDVRNSDIQSVIDVYQAALDRYNAR